MVLTTGCRPIPVEVYISRLRKRLADAGVEIRTRRGIGCIVSAGGSVESRNGSLPDANNARRE